MKEDPLLWRDQKPSDHTLPVDNLVLGKKSRKLQYTFSSYKNILFLLALPTTLYIGYASSSIWFNGERDQYLSKISALEEERKKTKETCRDRDSDIRNDIRSLREEMQRFNGSTKSKIIPKDQLMKIEPEN